MQRMLVRPSAARRAALALAGAVLLAAAGASPAHARSCSLAGDYGKLGPTYASQLRVSNTSCSTGKKVIRALHSCDISHGGRRGHCPHRVLGYRCSERRSYGFASFDASVRCTRGTRRVNYVYQQNL
jgi:hypothetical protein